jgi:hypothetical protein
MAIIVLLLVIFFPGEGFSSIFTTLYDDTLNLLKMYSVSFEIDLSHNDRFFFYPFRENIYPKDVDLFGYDQYFGNETLRRDYKFKLSCKFSPQMSLSFNFNDTPPYVKLDQTRDNNYWLIQKGDSKLELTYQISPKYSLLFNSTYSNETNMYAFSFKKPLLTSTYMRWTMKSTEDSIKGITFGGKMRQDWGDMKFTAYFNEKYTRYPFPTFSLGGEEERQSWWLYDDLVSSQYGITLDYNIIPNTQLRLSGTIDWLIKDYDTQEADSIIKRKTIYYPFTLNYRPQSQKGDEWEFGLSLENKIYQEENLLLKSLLRTAEEWEIIKQDKISMPEKLELSAKRYFEGLTLSLKFYRKSSADVYIYQDEIMTKDERQYIWKYWDLDVLSYGIVYGFDARPLPKLNFSASVEYSPWKEYRTLSAELKKEQTVSYDFSAMYKPIRLFDIYARKKVYYITDAISEPKMRPSMNTDDIWKVTGSNGRSSYYADEVGLNFRYPWITVGVGLLQEEKSMVYFEREQVQLPEKKTHPWRYGDWVIQPITLRFSYSIVPALPVLIDGYFAWTPDYLLSDKEGMTIWFGNTMNSISLRYEFTPLFYLQFRFMSTRVYQKEEYILLREKKSPLSTTDILDNTYEINFSIVYRG